MSSGRYALAPMSAAIFVMTVLILPLPLVLFFVGARVNPRLGLVPGLLVATIWALIWFWFRPTRFELSPAGLRLVWPIRNDLIPLRDIESAELVSSAEFRSRYGRGMRIGAGGLWGGFGWCWTPKRMLRLYISRIDRYVLVHTRRGRPLMISPERPEAFLIELKQLLGA